MYVTLYWKWIFKSPITTAFYFPDWRLLCQFNSFFSQKGRKLYFKELSIHLFYFLHILTALTMWSIQSITLTQRTIAFLNKSFIFLRSIPWASQDKCRQNGWAQMRRGCEGTCRLSCDGGIYAGTSSCCTFKASSAHVWSLGIGKRNSLYCWGVEAWLDGCPLENQSRVV